MKKRTLIIIILCTYSLISCNSSDKISLEGKLYKLSEQKADCGVLAFASVMEFEVENVIYEKSDENVTRVIVPCPELYGKDFFKINETYKLTLEQGNNSDTDYVLIDNPKRSTVIQVDKEYWAIKITHK